MVMGSVRLISSWAKRSTFTTRDRYG